MGIKHLEEFEIYYNLGNSRSYREVAERIGKSPRTVETWGLKEKWSDEVKLRDLEILKEQRKQTVKERTQQAKKYKEIVNASIGEYIKKLQKNEIEITSICDLDRLIRLSCFLDGYMDSTNNINTGEINTETKVEETLNHELSKKTLETMNQIIESYQNINKPRKQGKE